ncbi:CGEA protein [Bacillus cereus]|nr:CGEA protein [Bacillus cereus]
MSTKYKSSIFLLLFSIPRGTIVSRSGFVYGPATFRHFDIITGTVTLEEQDLPSPGFTPTIQISCDAIESITTTSD